MSTDSPKRRTSLKRRGATTKQRVRALEASPSAQTSAGEDRPVDEGLRRILSLLKSKLHVDLGPYKPTTIQRRIERRMRLARFDTMSAFASHLRDNPDALQELHDDLFIHVTQFFRDPEAYAALKELVFPRLLKDRAPDDPIRVWVPGCSTGEEAYSLAMALWEFCEAENAQPGLQLFATDISEAAIERARKAVYPESAVAELDAERLERFFEPVKDGFRLCKKLRELCIVSRHDITRNAPFSKLDLISCRNVLIYFGTELQQQVIPVFHYSLKPGGFLWLGKSETPGTPSKHFNLIDKQNKIYAKAAPAVARSASQLQMASSRWAAERLAPPRDFARLGKGASELQKSADELVLHRFGPPGVVINQELEILHFRGKTVPFLEPGVGQPTHGLLKMAHRDLLVTLRPLMHAVKKQNRPLRKEATLLEEGGTRRDVTLEVTPLNPLAPERERQYLLLFAPGAPAKGKARSREDVPAKKAKPREKGSTRSEASEQHVQQLQQELDAVREHQQTLIEQFESAHEELTSANEELQATNEEFQSTNEELETAQEELQSSNEELTTMNDELQSRNAELLAAYEKLARGEDRFRLMVEGVKDYAIYMLDPDGRVTSWNEGARRLKGYEATEMIGQHYSRFFLPEDVAAGAPELELDRARIEGRFEAEGWRQRRDGTRFWANVVVTRINDSSGTLIGFSKVTRDLTERRRSAEELEKSEQRFRLMVSAVRDYAIFLLDPEGRIASWNEGARRLKGYAAEEILGKHFSIFYPPEDIAAGKVEREIEIVLADGRVEDEGWRVRKDGSHFWANVVITRLNDQHGNLIGFTKVTRDLSERKRAEQQLRRTNESLEARVVARTKELERALLARDEFLSIASHELKTPLTGLKLQLQLGQRNLQRQVGAAGLLTGDQAASVFDRPLRQAVALEELIDDLLDVSRVQTGRMRLERREVDLSAVIEDVAARYSDVVGETGNALKLDLRPGIVGRWDERRIAQVLVNLISNALKYAPQSPISISTRGEDAQVEIVVQDFGPGISQEKLAHIFKPFERAGASPNVGGLGLGLFIVRHIVQAHQGTIRVESEVGKGTRFVLRLPLLPRGGDSLAGGET